jgi:signal transduction histidine kinase
MVSRPNISLNHALNKVLVTTLLLVFLTIAGVLVGYSQIKLTLSKNAIWTELEKSVDKQIESLIPAFLIPEQRSGADILLERFKSAENLSEIKIIQDLDSLPGTLINCKLLMHKSVSCINEAGDQLALISPIKEGSTHFGHLLKSKKMVNPFINDSMLQMIEIVSIVLILAFVPLFILLTRLTSKHIPREINNLVSWLEKNLKGDKTLPRPQLQFSELDELGGQIADLLKEHEVAQRLKVTAQVSAQVAHDIRSPLAALEVATRDLTSLPSDTRLLMTQATARIKDMADQFLSRNRELVQNFEENHFPQKNKLAPSSLVLMLQEIIQEKKLELSRHKTINIKLSYNEQDAKLIVMVQKLEFQRLISNLLNNAVNASKLSGEIEIKLDVKTPFVEVAINDDGIGISPEKLKNILQNRTQGLGLTHARHYIEEFNGTLNIKSIAGQGTCVAINLPLMPQNAVLIDDDELVRFSWELAAKGASQSIATFGSVDEFIKQHAQFSPYTPIYLDSHLGAGEQGEIMAEEIYKLGFHNITLATSKEASEIQMTPWVRSIRDKTYPWMA